jgi:hypothetical protein
MPWPPTAEAEPAVTLPDLIDHATNPYQTRLAPDHEKEFQAWLKVTGAPFDPSHKADYDMRGYWQALRAGDPRAQTEINAADREMHFPDTWKTPYHKTFSAESVYAQPGAPTWQGDLLIGQNGHIIADERPPAPTGAR